MHLNLLLALGLSTAVDMNFNRIASFPVMTNSAMTEKETSAEIIAVTANGRTLVYTDSPLGVIGMIDIIDAANPVPLGTMAMGGEPTSVAIAGTTAFVGVNTSESYTAPSGQLKAVDVASKTELAVCDLGGQPDAVATNGDFVAVAIENERDEDLGDGRTGQMPAGFLALVDIVNDRLACGSLKTIDLTGLAAVSPEDPEPEFVDINDLGEIVVSLQENNHMVVVSAEGRIIHHFSAGDVDLAGIDATDAGGALIFNENQPGRVREPDAVRWIDNDHFATANEGDMDGGARGWTIFNKNGRVVYESGPSFEHAMVRIGHYPDKRSDSKGVEPESIETATFGTTPMVFVGSERGSIVGVYDVTDLDKPVLRQLLPSGIGPEGYVAIPERNLLISANEVDGREDGAAPAHIMIYRLSKAPAQYPMLTSAGADQLLGWGAISGMVAGEGSIIHAVSDGFYSDQPSIFTIDASTTPARITDVIRVTRQGRPAQNLDLEGITLDGDGGFWLASEGNTEKQIPHALYRVNAKGEIMTEIPLPAELLAVEQRFGMEGITKVGSTLWMAIQREWRDDPANHAKLVAYNLITKQWGAVHYPKEAPAKGWVGLSEITAYGNHVYIIERDNQIAANAAIKLLTRVPLSQMRPAPLGSKPAVVSKEIVRDLLPDLAQTKGYIQDKVEGLAIFPDGTAWVSTDNDGVDDHSGETLFWTIGRL